MHILFETNALGVHDGCVARILCTKGTARLITFSIPTSNFGVVMHLSRSCYVSVERKWARLADVFSKLNWVRQRVYLIRSWLVNNFWDAGTFDCQNLYFWIDYVWLLYIYMCFKNWKPSLKSTIYLTLFYSCPVPCLDMAAPIAPKP